jgi:hypothetical protein
MQLQIEFMLVKAFEEPLYPGRYLLYALLGWLSVFIEKRGSTA